MAYCIKFSAIKPTSPHLVRKLERFRKRDLEEFYALVDLSDFEKLREESERAHGALKGKTQP